MIPKIVMIGLGLMLVAKARQTAKMHSRANIEQRDPSNWQGDMWTRLQGIDLTIDGEHGAPSGFDAYGMNGELSTRTPCFNQMSACTGI